MRHLVRLVFFLLALGALRTVGCLDENPCGDCSDGNPCTIDYCEPDETLDFNVGCKREDPSYSCRHSPLEDGTSCEVGGQTGVCESGGCRLEGEARDGGV